MRTASAIRAQCPPNDPWTEEREILRRTQTSMIIVNTRTAYYCSAVAANVRSFVPALHGPVHVKSICIRSLHIPVFIRRGAERRGAPFTMVGSWKCGVEWSQSVSQSQIDIGEMGKSIIAPN